MSHQQADHGAMRNDGHRFLALAAHHRLHRVGEAAPGVVGTFLSEHHLGRMIEKPLPGGLKVCWVGTERHRVAQMYMQSQHAAAVYAQGGGRALPCRDGLGLFAGDHHARQGLHAPERQRGCVASHV